MILHDVLYVLDCIKWCRFALSILMISSTALILSLRVHIIRKRGMFSIFVGLIHTGRGMMYKTLSYRMGSMWRNNLVTIYASVLGRPHKRVSWCPKSAVNRLFSQKLIQANTKENDNAPYSWLRCFCQRSTESSTWWGYGTICVNQKPDHASRQLEAVTLKMLQVIFIILYHHSNRNNHRVLGIYMYRKCLHTPLTFPPDILIIYICIGWIGQKLWDLSASK